MGLGWQRQTEGQLEGLRQAGKYLLAVERVRSKTAAYRLTKDQMEQVKEHEATEKTVFEYGLRAYGQCIPLCGSGWRKGSLSLKRVL